MIFFNTLIFSNGLLNVGKNVKFYPGLVVRYPGKISIGNNCVFNQNILLGSELDSCSLLIGNNVSISSNVKIDFSGGVIIQDNVTISDNVKIITHDHGLNPRSKPNGNSLIIQNNVWIAANVIVMHNVKSIGSNSIIAAGSILTKDVPPYCVMGGNPAKVIRFLQL